MLLICVSVCLFVFVCVCLHMSVCVCGAERAFVGDVRGAEIVLRKYNTWQGGTLN